MGRNRNTTIPNDLATQAAEIERLKAEVEALKAERQSFATKFARNLAQIALESTVHAFDHPECYPSLTELRGCLGPNWVRTDDIGDCQT